MTCTTKFYSFRQNNSGGRFNHDETQGIGINVIVEAVDATHANARAESIGLYFDGCAKEIDCDCCGDRWYPAYEGGGTDVPDIYGKKYRATLEGEAPYKDWDLPSYLHPINESFCTITEDVQ